MPGRQAIGSSTGRPAVPDTRRPAGGVATWYADDPGPRIHGRSGARRA
ncbi:hypothetical protein TOK_6211 [Pseudonocardia sp. N23]|nr:hypothetical protein TOK_6211 [Pseudonocardia sp. N23]